MAWQMTGQFIETCSCNMLCPCWFGVPELAVQDQGYCAGAIVVRVQQGAADGVDLSGRTVVWADYFPQNMFEGNGTARLYMDEAANADQRQQLEAIFMGQRGGPMAALAPLVTRWLPTQTANIQVQEDGDSITVTVGAVGQVKSQRLRDGEGQTLTLQGGGFVGGLRMEALELAPSATRWADQDLPGFETKSGGRGTVTWSG